jgi:YfiR/HmsC-like
MSVHRLKAIRSAPKWATVALLCLFGYAGMPCPAQATGADEAEVRALMIYNLTKFVEWPKLKLVSEHDPFLICVLGDDSIASQLDNLLRGKQVQGRSAIVRQVKSGKNAEECEVLYASDDKRTHLAEFSAALAKAAVLTISGQHLSREGTVIGLPFVERRIGIEVDAEAAKRSGLSISSKLLQFAAVTR